VQHGKLSTKGQAERRKLYKKRRKKRKRVRLTREALRFWRGQQRGRAKDWLQG
jgi:hypothetical protein